MPADQTTLVLLIGLTIPLLGTTLGSACVFLTRGQLSDSVQRAFTGFAAGIMVAASVWSLLIPSMEESAAQGVLPERLAFLPAAVGFLAGTGFLLLLDHVVPHLHMGAQKAEGPTPPSPAPPRWSWRSRSTTSPRAWRWAWSWRAG